MSDPANPSASQKQDFLPPWGKWLLGVVALLTVILLIWEPGWQTSYLHHHGSSVTRQQIFDDEDEARKTLATIFGGIVVVFGSIVGYLNFLNADKSFKLAKKKNADDATLTERKLNTDRYATAVGMLSKPGDAEMATRLGGIYLLETLAKDAEGFYVPVMDVLVAYIRNNRPARNISGDILEYSSYKSDEEAILTVVFRRIIENEGSYVVDLRDTNLDEAKLTGANLVNANLSNSVARKAILDKVDLSGAVLSNAIFTESSFFEANLERAQGKFIDFSRASIDRANLNESILNSGNFSDAFLSKSVLTSAYLSKSNFSNADLDGADFSDSTLRLVNFNEAFLKDTNFKNAKMMGANIAGTFLSETKNITQGQFDSTKGLPAGLPPNLHILSPRRNPGV